MIVTHNFICTYAPDLLKLSLNVLVLVIVCILVFVSSGLPAGARACNGLAIDARGSDGRDARAERVGELRMAGAGGRRDGQP